MPVKPVNTLFPCKQTDSLNMVRAGKLIYRADPDGMITAADEIFEIAGQACRLAANVNDVIDPVIRYPLQCLRVDAVTRRIENDQIRSVSDLIKHFQHITRNERTVM